MIKKNLEELIYLREEELMNMEYPHNRMCICKKYWYEFARFCKNNNIDTFEEYMVDKYINSTYSTDSDNKSNRQSIRAMKILMDINYVNDCISYKPINENELNDYYKETLNDYLKFYRVVRENSNTTINDKRMLSINFFIYLQNYKISTIESITKNIILGFMSSF